MGDVEDIVKVVKSLIATHEQAKALHAQFHEKIYDVAKIKKSASFDVPPWSFFYGASDIGGWDGILSTDGQKLVITKGGYFKEGKVTASWVISKDEIASVKVGVFKTKITFKQPIKGLTTPSLFESLLLICCGIVPYFMYDKRKIRLRVSNEFKNSTEMGGILTSLAP